MSLDSDTLAPEAISLSTSLRSSLMSFSFWIRRVMRPWCAIACRDKMLSARCRLVQREGGRTSPVSGLVIFALCG